MVERDREPAALQLEVVELRVRALGPGDRRRCLGRRRQPPRPARSPSPTLSSTAEAMAGRRSNVKSLQERGGTHQRPCSIPPRSPEVQPGQSRRNPQRPGKRVVDEHPPRPDAVGVHQSPGPGLPARAEEPIAKRLYARPHQPRHQVRGQAPARGDQLGHPRVPPRPHDQLIGPVGQAARGPGRDHRLQPGQPDHVAPGVVGVQRQRRSRGRATAPHRARYTSRRSSPGRSPGRGRGTRRPARVRRARRSLAPRFTSLAEVILAGTQHAPTPARRSHGPPPRPRLAPASSDRPPGRR